MKSSLRVFFRDVLQTLLVVAVFAGLLFGGSGVWPPLVAVESGSMEPNMVRGDLVYVTAPDRWTVEAAEGTPIVTATEAGDYERLGGPGDVIVYDPPGREGSPIIHRAHFSVEAGEDWFARANPSYLPPGIDNCADLRNCPAPNGGYITKGDANAYYDQVSGIAPPVEAEWVLSKGRARIPWLGWIRLLAAGAMLTPPVGW